MILSVRDMYSRREIRSAIRILLHFCIQCPPFVHPVPPCPKPDSNCPPFAPKFTCKCEPPFECDTSVPQRDPIVVPNNAPLETITFNLGFGDEVIEVLASCEKTDGANDILRITLPPNSVAPQHRHLNNDEWFYVLEGQVNMLVKDQIIPANPGDFIYVKRGTNIGYMNGPNPTRFIVGFTPGGQIGAFRKLANFVNNLPIPPPPMEVIIAQVFKIFSEYCTVDAVPPMVPLPPPPASTQSTPTTVRVGASSGECFENKLVPYQSYLAYLLQIFCSQTKWHSHRLSTILSSRTTCPECPQNVLIRYVVSFLPLRQRHYLSRLT